MLNYQFTHYLLILCFFCISWDVQAEKSAENEKTTSEQTKEKHWSDSFHQGVANSVQRSALWFDSFFVHDGTEQTAPKTSARIRLGWIPKARDWGDFEQRFKVKVRLPHLEDKVDLIFTDGEEQENSNLPLNSSRINPDNSQSGFTAAIRYIFEERENVITSSRIGLSGGSIFARIRHKRIYTWNDKHRFSFQPSVLYDLSDKTGARLQLEYEYQINDKQQFRIDSSLFGSESFHGVRWLQGFYHLKHISDKAATLCGIQISGELNGTEGSFVGNYSFNYRYRFNALKDWLHFEIEPFISFPRDENYKITPGIALRVEGFFYQK